MEYYLTNLHITDFYKHLILEEKEYSTIKKYFSELQNFLLWLGERPITKEIIYEWKEKLCQSNYQANTINSKLSVINKFLTFIGLLEGKLK